MFMFIEMCLRYIFFYEEVYMLKKKGKVFKVDIYFIEKVIWNLLLISIVYIENIFLGFVLVEILLKLILVKLLYVKYKVVMYVVNVFGGLDMLMGCLIFFLSLYS